MNRATFKLPDREAIVDVISILERQEGYKEYTRIRVQHRGPIQCVVEIPAKGWKRFFDPHTYMEWKTQKGQIEMSYAPLRGYRQVIPRRVKARIGQVPTAFEKMLVPLAAKWVKHILDDPEIAALRGYIMIEPEQILWLKREAPLRHEFLENAVNALARLAERVEEGF